MEINLEGTGLSLIFKPYQVEIVKLLLNKKEVGSREAWQYIQDKPVQTKSRASVINFLNAMVKEGVMKDRSTTGKGGHRGNYSLRVDEKGLWRHFINKTARALSDASGIPIKVITAEIPA